MLAKINSVRGAGFALALALALSGCTPAGPGALFQGKKYLERGDFPAAVAQFKRATTLLATNAGAWNYLGVALHHAGQSEEAAAAYQTALRLDHDLVEARFNLGVLWLEQNKPDAAKAELTTYTLRRPNDADGWLKLGFAQLKGGGDTLPAERSFSAVLALKTREAEAYNGLGLASLQAGKPRDAAQFFAAARQARPEFAPALLNLATVNLEYLHDHKAALASYQSYLALTPRPANYNEVKALVATLAQSDAAATVMAPVGVVKTSTPVAAPEPKLKIASASTPHPAPATRMEVEELPASHAPPRATVAAKPAATAVVTPVATQSVRVQSGPEIVVTPRTNRPNRVTVATAPKPATTVVATQGSPEAPVPDEEPPKPGFWHRVFHNDKSPGGAKPDYRADNLQPIPAATETMAGTVAEEKPAAPKPEPAASIARYHFLSPAAPAAGDRRLAESPFNKARLAEQEESWADAEQGYQAAAEADPSWFEAQYNSGVIAHRLRHFSVALPRYELALAIRPDSTDARYNFALALQTSGYALDAADELKKILATHPNEVRAHLTLANLCAQSLRDDAQARRHYLRVLDLQPDIPQAADIRFWLSANAK